MTEQETLSTLSRILGELLANDAVKLTMETRRSDVEGWDSFTYINFIVAVEQEFRIKLGLAEIESFDNVGSIVARIRRTVS